MENVNDVTDYVSVIFYYSKEGSALELRRILGGSTEPRVGKEASSLVYVSTVTC